MQGTCFRSGSQCSIFGHQQELVDVAIYLLVHLVLFSVCIAFRQPPILALEQSVVQRSC
jgi:hypothetical protein